jgi:predicted dinucleotide-binding enzyme
MGGSRPTDRFWRARPQSPKTKAGLPIAGLNGRTASVQKAISSGEIILFFILWVAVPEILAHNAAGLKDKIVIDVTRICGSPVINNLAAIREAAPSAQVYHATNALDGRSLRTRSLLER